MSPNSLNLRERLATLEDRVLITHQSWLGNIEKKIESMDHKMLIIILLICGSLFSENYKHIIDFASAMVKG